MEKLINEWDIIDTFFRDTEYYKSQHQIESFGKTIFSFKKYIQKLSNAMSIHTF